MSNLYFKNGLKLLLASGLSVVLVGCGTSDDLDESLSKDTQMSFVNSLDYMADFYVDRHTLNTNFSGLFDSDNRKSSDVPKNSKGSTYTYSYKFTNKMVNFGVRNSNTNEQEEKVYRTLKDNQNLWVIAWNNSGDPRISTVAKKSDNKADMFNIRVFADGKYSITVDGNEVLSTKSGDVTDYFSVNNCETGLAINGNSIDLCSGDLGKSYLLVADASGKRVMVQE